MCLLLNFPYQRFLCLRRHFGVFHALFGCAICVFVCYLCYLCVCVCYLCAVVCLCVSVCVVCVGVVCVLCQSPFVTTWNTNTTNEPVSFPIITPQTNVTIDWETTPLSNCCWRERTTPP